MARGNGIILSPNPKGVFLEGIISGTPYPGTVMQIKAATAPVGGRLTWEVYNQAADGNQALVAVLLPDDLQGKPATSAYADGDHGFFYCPAMGEELNMLMQNQSGTADAFAIGDKLMVDDGTGLLIATTGSPEAEPFIVTETIAALTADALHRVMFTGY